MHQTCDSLSGLCGSDFTLTDEGVDSGDPTTNSAKLTVIVELSGCAAEAQIQRLLLGLAQLIDKVGEIQFAQV
jgi:hypothetical protein